MIETASLSFLSSEQDFPDGSSSLCPQVSFGQYGEPWIFSMDPTVITVTSGWPRGFFVHVKVP